LESQKSEVLQSIEGRGLTLSDVAEKIGFDPNLLRLYFAQDSYPVPKRIIDKLVEAITS
jgi:hypothetical protein